MPHNNRLLHMLPLLCFYPCICVLSSLSSSVYIGLRPFSWKLFELSRHNECVDRQTDEQSDYYRTSVFSMKGSHLFKSIMTVRSYGLNTDFGFVLTLTLTIVDMTLLMVMTHPRFMVNLNIFQIQRGSKELCPDTEFAYVFTVTFTLEIKPLV